MQYLIGRIRVLKFIIFTIFIYPVFCFSNMDICLDGSNLSNDCQQGTMTGEEDFIYNGIQYNSTYDIGFLGNQNTNSFLKIDNDYFKILGDNSYGSSKNLWTPIGFLGTKRTINSPNYILPVGQFSKYIGSDLIFPDKIKENDFSNYPFIKNIDVNNGGNYFCNSINGVTNSKILLKNNGVKDYINISFDNPYNQKIKIVKLFPIKEEYIIDGNNFDDYVSIYGKYLYYIVSYNDCNNTGIQSQILTLDYFSSETSLEFQLEGNSIKLISNPIEYVDNVSITSISCIDTYGKNIFEKNTFGIKVDLNNELLSKSFICYGKAKLNNGDNLEINDFIYFPENSYISEKDSLNYIYSLLGQEFNINKLYLNSLKYEEKIYITYGKMSLYLVNLFGGIYISSEDLSLDLLKKYGLVGSDITRDMKINGGEFLKILIKISQSSKNFKNNSLDFLEKNFGKSKYGVISYDLSQNNYVINSLNGLQDKTIYNTMLVCLSDKSCSNYNFISSSIKDIKYNQDIDIVTYKDYIKQLYYILGYDSYISNSIDKQKYDKFIDILVESVVNNYDFYNTNIDYIGYINLQSEFELQAKLKKNINFLINNYIDNIITIYSTKKKDDLLDLIGDFLG